jgi:ABC-type multidrug transport system permease subunit
MTALALSGLAPLYSRRLAIAVKTVPGMIGQITTPILWVLVVAPALNTALGNFRPDVDYFTYVAVAQVAFLLPFTAMFSGLQVIIDANMGILPELLVAPIRRAAIPIANAFAVLTVGLAQVALLLGLATLRGAHFHTSVAGVLWFIAGASLLLLTVYGVAEILTVVVRNEVYGPLIPAIGVTPWFLSGSLFPLTVLPAGIEQLAVLLPWTHALALMRYGLMHGSPSGLHDIWHLGSPELMAVLSLLVLVGFAVVSLGLAARVFKRTTTL